MEKPGDHIAESELVGRIAAGDRIAMRRFYDEYAGYLTAVCARYVSAEEDVKDVLQDCFIRIFDSIGRFEWRGPGALRAWAARIVVNESLKYLRNRKKLRMMVNADDCADSGDEAGEGAGAWAGTGVGERGEAGAGEDGFYDVNEIPEGVIMEMIRALPEGYRTVFNLYVFERKSHREIALALSIAESSSASQLHRARNTLARKIKEYGLKKEQNYG